MATQSCGHATRRPPPAPHGLSLCHTRGRLGSRELRRSIVSSVTAIRNVGYSRREHSRESGRLDGPHGTVCKSPRSRNHRFQIGVIEMVHDELFALDGRSRVEALAAYCEARYVSCNFVAKRRLDNDPDYSVSESEYAAKNQTAIDALRCRVAQLGIDETCDPGMLSVRMGGRGKGHIPASEIPEDIHSMILGQLSDDDLCVA